MGAVILGSLPDVLRDAGVPVKLWPGFETRSRSTGGFEQLLGVGHHHDAIPAHVSEDARSRAGWDNTSNANRPVGNCRIERDGTWVIGSLMATNTQGRGPALRMSKGTIPANQANLHMLSLEPSNDGIGQPWPKDQTDSILTGTAAICLAYALAPGDNRAHFETAPSRKIDPWGPSEFNNHQRAAWDMTVFRARLAALMGAMSNEGDDEMTQQQYRALDAKLEAIARQVRTQDARMDYLTNQWARSMGTIAGKLDVRSNMTTNTQLPAMSGQLDEIAAAIAEMRDGGAIKP